MATSLYVMGSYGFTDSATFNLLYGEQMNNGLLQVLVEEDGGYKKEGGNWGRSLEHSSLVVNEEAQRWYWNSENMGGTALDYLIKVRRLDKKTAEKIINIRGKVITGSLYDTEDEYFSLPQERLVDLLWELGKGNREYWYHRLLTDKTIDRHRLGFFDGWYTLPLYEGDRFVNFQMRRDKPTKSITQWYRTEKWEPSLINQGILSLVDTVFITEGTIDCLLLNQEGIPSVAQTTSAFWSPKWFPFFSRIKTVYYITDNDDVGRLAAERAAKNLGMDKVRLYEFTGKPEKFDTIDWFREGGKAKEFRQMVEQESQFLFEKGVVYEYNGRAFGKSIRASRTR